MDTRAWRSLAVSFALFGGVGLVFLLGAKLLGITGAGAARQWLALARGPLGSASRRRRVRDPGFPWSAPVSC